MEWVAVAAAALILCSAPAGLNPLVLLLGALGIGAAGAAANKGREELSGELKTPEPTDPEQQEGSVFDRRPALPGVKDVAEAAYTDTDIQNKLFEEDFQRRLGSLNDLQSFLQNLPDTVQQGVSSALQGGFNQSRQFDANIQNIAKTSESDALRFLNTARDTNFQQMQRSIEAIQGGLQGAERAFDFGNQQLMGAKDFTQQQLSGALQSIAGAKSFNIEQINAAAERGRQAMEEFGTTLGSQMQTWSVGHMQQLEQMKQEEAARLRDLGYRPEEIEQRLRQMDMQGAMQQAQQFGQFQTFETEARRQMRQAYDQMTTQTAQIAANNITNLAGIESTTRTAASQITASLSQAQAGMAQWIGGERAESGRRIADIRQKTADRDTLLQQQKAQVKEWSGALQSQSKLALMDEAFRAGTIEASSVMSANFAKMNGQTALANLHQTLSHEYAPYTPVVSGMWAIKNSVLNRHLGAQSDAFSDILNGINALAGGVQNFIGSLLGFGG